MYKIKNCQRKEFTCKLPHDSTYTYKLTLSCFTLPYIGFQPVPPLPPSIANNRSSMVPNHRSYSSTTDITALLAQYRDSSILSPPTSANYDMYNTRPSSQCSYSISTTSSGRTSPVIIEEEEVKEDVGNRKFLTPPTSTSQQGTLLSKSKQTYDSSSLPRRRQGGGLKRTLSLYQENRRQVAMAREKRGLERGKSFDVSSRSKIEAQTTSQISSSNTGKCLIKYSILLERLVDRQCEYDTVYSRKLYC